MPSSLFFGITSGLTTSSHDWSRRTTPMALSPTLIWSLLEDYCTWRLSPRPLTSRNVLSYQKGITSAPLSGSKKVVPLQTSLLLTSCGSLEFANISTDASHGLTTLREPPTTLLDYSSVSCDRDVIGYLSSKSYISRQRKYKKKK